MEKGNINGAEEKFQEAIKLQENGMEAHEGLGICYSRLYSIIAKEFDDAMIDGGVSIDYSLLTLSIHWANGAYVELGRAIDMGSNRAEVFKALDAVLPAVEQLTDRPSSSDSSEFDSEAYDSFITGQTYLVRGNYAEAIKLLEAAVHKCPQNAYWKGELGAAYLGHENYNDAIKILQEVSGNRELSERYQLAPWYSTVCYNLGTAHFRLGQMSKAKKAFREFLSREPNSADAQKLRKLIPDL